MRGQAMKKILEILERKSIDLSKMQALEVFGREGDWQTVVYADKVKSLDVWEIDPIFEKGLRKNLPKANIKIVDSIQEIKKRQHFSKYEFIVIDNAQNCYGPKNRYCEHFDVIPNIAKLLNKKGIIIFNINKEPFDFEKFPHWQKRRSRFYNTKNTTKLTIDWLLDFYKEIFKKFGYLTRFCFNISRNDYKHNDYLHYLVYLLEKNDKFY